MGTFDAGGGDPGGTNIIRVNWIFSCNLDGSGEVVRPKARLLARGFGQHAEIEYFKSLLSCRSVTSIRHFAALACELRLDLCDFDAEEAVVQRRLKVVLFIRLPHSRGALFAEVVRLPCDHCCSRQASQPRHHHLKARMKGLRFRIRSMTRLTDAFQGGVEHSPMHLSRVGLALLSSGGWWMVLT